MTKQCIECGATKSKLSTSRYGYKYEHWIHVANGYLCKRCYDAKYYRIHQAELQEYARKYAPVYKKEHPEKVWQVAHRDKYNAYFRQYRKDHPEKFREYERRRRAKQIA